MLLSKPVFFRVLVVTIAAAGEGCQRSFRGLEVHRLHAQVRQLVVHPLPAHATASCRRTRCCAKSIEIVENRLSMFWKNADDDRTMMMMLMIMLMMMLVMMMVDDDGDEYDKADDADDAGDDDDGKW